MFADSLGPLPVGTSVEDLPWHSGTLSQGVRAIVNLCLESAAPTVLIWGEERRLIYNQAHVPLIGQRHPELFGAPLPRGWPEAWAVIKTEIEEAFASGETHQIIDQEVVFDRDGDLLDGYLSYTTTAVRASDDSVIGVFIPVLETTQSVLRRRRLATLHALAAEGVQDGSSEQLIVRMAEVLARNLDDVPFSLMYLIEPSASVGTLRATSGLVRPAGCAPRQIRLNDDSEWPVLSAISRETPLFVDDVQHRFPGMLAGRSGMAPQRAMMSFVDQGNERLPNAINILGVGPRLELDAGYQAFLHAVAQQLKADLGAVTSARLERERAADLQLAMQNNRKIGTAIGILMSGFKVTEQTAFQLMSTASRRTDRKLLEIAVHVIKTGALPAEGAEPVDH